MLGNTMASVAQYRFSVAALVPDEMAGKAIAGVMVGT
jgi:hypothetical protein